MKKITLGLLACCLLIAAPAFAAPPAAAPAPYSWTGFYGGIQFGGGWSDQAVNFSPNDADAAALLSSRFGETGEQPVAGGYRIPQSGAVGGFEAGYNWQAGSNWLWGMETDFSFSGMSGQATGPTSFIINIPPTTSGTQQTAATQSTNWYGTVRGRAGYLATPNLLLFGTGGFAYGRTGSSATYSEPGVAHVTDADPTSFDCAASPTPCFAGSASGVRTGWSGGGGIEWLLDRHWSAKIEYQFVDLGTQTVRVTALAVAAPGDTPASFNAVIRDQFNVVRIGLNCRF